MSYPAIISKALERLSSVDTARSNKAPPIHRLAWRAGIAVPPPLFASFGFNFLFMGIFFGLGWSASMFLFFVATGHDPAWMAPIMALMAVPAGALFGLAMATCFRSIAVKNGLPSWRSFKFSQSRIAE